MAHLAAGLLIGAAAAGITHAATGIPTLSALIASCAAVVYWLLAYITWGAARMDGNGDD